MRYFMRGLTGGIVAFWMVSAMFMVGKTGPCTPFPWYMPLSVLFALGAPVLLGWEAGRDYEQNWRN